MKLAPGRSGSCEKIAAEVIACIDAPAQLRYTSARDHGSIEPTSCYEGKKNGMRKVTTASAIVAAAAALTLASPIPAMAQGLTEEPAEADIEIEEFQDWNLRCTEQDGQRRWEMMQPINDPESGEPVMAVVIPGTPADQPLVAWFILPLGVLLPPGIAISIDGSEPERLPIRHCEPSGCLAPIELKDDITQRLRGGSELQLMAYDIDEEQVSIPISLMGFTSALNALPR